MPICCVAATVLTKNKGLELRAKANGLLEISTARMFSLLTNLTAMIWSRPVCFGAVASAALACNKARPRLTAPLEDVHGYSITFENIVVCGEIKISEAYIK